jgi:hypothetical protein
MRLHRFIELPQIDTCLDQVQRFLTVLMRQPEITAVTVGVEAHAGTKSAESQPDAEHASVAEPVVLSASS